MVLCNRPGKFSSRLLVSPECSAVAQGRTIDEVACRVDNPPFLTPVAPLFRFLSDSMVVYRYSRGSKG